MTFFTKLAYGSGDVGAAITAILLLSYLSPFLTDVAHLSPGLARQSQLVGKVWDAINDPMVGVMSDRGQIFSDKIRQRWGRRYPLMLWGAIPFGTYNRSKSVAARHLEEFAPVTIPFGEQLRLVFANRPFLFVVGIYLASWFALLAGLGVSTAYLIPWSM